jgi:hypothetical protein
LTFLTGIFDCLLTHNYQDYFSGAPQPWPVKQSEKPQKWPLLPALLTFSAISRWINQSIPAVE